MTEILKEMLVNQRVRNTNKRVELEISITFTLTHYSSVCFSIPPPPENISEPLGFLIFSGGIEKQRQAVLKEKNNQKHPVYSE